MTEDEHKNFAEIKKIGFTKGNQDDVSRFLADLHARYFNHSFYLPCSCSPKTWQQWIDQLNVIHRNGFRSDS
tara:strand:+ start:423 stop:638 length:216 start_codon:yes stop_codon:yes gene_type:complete